MIAYRAPQGVRVERIDGRPVLRTAQGGKIALDEALLALWQQAQNSTLDEVLAAQPADNPVTTRAALACLAEAQLLERVGMPDTPCRLLELEGTLVSAVMVGFNSRGWLEESLPSLLAQTYHPLEIIFVDNASSDGSSEWVQVHFPQVRVVRLEVAVTFSRANNFGIQSAGGDSIFLINPDVRLEPDALAQMVCTALQSAEPVIVNAKLRLWWAPAFINGIGNRVGPFSWGTDNAIGHLDLGQFDHWTELPSACFAAVLIPTAIYAQVGLIDEQYPMYYEDADWSYRARLFGYKILPAPDAVVYHAFGGSVPGGKKADALTPQKLCNVVYGRYRFAYKIVGGMFGRFVRNYWLEDWVNFTRRIISREWAFAGAYLHSWWTVLKTLPALLRERKAVQAQRRIDDEQLFSLQRDMPATLLWHGLPELTWDFVQSMYSPLILSGRTRSMPEFEPAHRRPHLLIVSNDVVDVKMAGPGMRYLEMARTLKDDIEVTLAVPQDTGLQVPNLRIVRYWEDRPASLKVLVENSDVTLISGYMAQKFAFLAEVKNRLVVDFYDPFVLENLHYYLNEPLSGQNALNQQAVLLTNRLAKLGDFFICGNERQRDYWMGVLTANGRVNPETFRQDSSLRDLIDLVGIGIPELPPAAGPMLKGIHPAVPADARIVLWGGGIWNWLDPLTLINAWPEVLKTFPEARLVFLGTRHPNPLVPRHQMAKQAEIAAAELGEKDRTIIFIEWVAYDEREALLCEADASVTLHPIHVETRYALRTRVLDSIWAGVPILITDGDITSEWIRQYQVGVVASEYDVESVSQGLITILSRPKAEWGANFRPLQEQLRWQKVVEPLRKYVLHGKHAPDWESARAEVAAPSQPRPAGRLAKAVYLYRTEGARVLLHRAWRYLQWRLSRP